MGHNSNRTLPFTCKEFLCFKACGTMFISINCQVICYKPFCAYCVSSQIHMALSFLRVIVWFGKHIFMYRTEFNQNFIAQICWIYCMHAIFAYGKASSQKLLYCFLYLKNPWLLSGMRNIAVRCFYEVSIKESWNGAV